MPYDQNKSIQRNLNKKISKEHITRKNFTEQIMNNPPHRFNVKENRITYLYFTP